MKKGFLYAVIGVFIILTVTACSSSRDDEPNTVSRINAENNEGSCAQITLPGKYNETLVDYEAVVDYRLSDTFESDYNSGKNITLNKQLTKDISDQQSSDMTLGYKWSNMVVDMLTGLDNPNKQSFGYVLSDINCDGVPELFWVREDNTILAVFTICGNEVKLLDAFWSHYQGVVTDNGEIYTKSSGGAAYSYYCINGLSSNSMEISSTKKFGIDGILYIDGSPTSEIYFEETSGEKMNIDKKRFEELLSIHPFQPGKKWKERPITFLRRQE